MPGSRTVIHQEMFQHKPIQVVLELRMESNMDLIQVLELNAKVSLKENPEMAPRMLGSVTVLQEETHSSPVTVMLEL